MSRDGPNFTVQTFERTHQKPVPTRGTSRRFKTSVPPSQNARKGQRRDAVSQNQRSSHQKSGKLTIHAGTIRFVHITLLVRGGEGGGGRGWGGDRPKPGQSAGHLPKRS